MERTDQRIVAAYVEKKEGKWQRCLIAHPGDVLPATHEKVYGPATQKECEAWLSANCSPDKESFDPQHFDAKDFDTEVGH